MFAPYILLELSTWELVVNMKIKDLENLRQNIFEIFQELEFPIEKVDVQARLTDDSFDKLRQDNPPKKTESPYSITVYCNQGLISLYRLIPLKEKPIPRKQTGHADNMGILDRLFKVKALLEKHDLNVEDMLISLLVSKEIFADVKSQLDEFQALGETALKIGGDVFSVIIQHPNDPYVDSSELSYAERLKLLSGGRILLKEDEDSE